MKNVACIIARTNSTRLPKKVLKEINGKKLIEYIIDKIKKVERVSSIYICTSEEQEDSVLEAVALDNSINFYAGSKDSIIDRMLDVAKIEEADNVIRITGDNIFTDEIYLDLMLKYHTLNKVDYTRTELLPLGVTAEVISVDSLKVCKKQMNPNDSQYLMLYMFQPSMFNTLVLIPPVQHQKSNWNLTVDTVNDWNRTEEIIKSISNINYEEILDICTKEKISNITYEPSGKIKLPSNLTINFETYRNEMELRAEESIRKNISINEYKELK